MGSSTNGWIWRFCRQSPSGAARRATAAQFGPGSCETLQRRPSTKRPHPMALAGYIKDIGRGAAGARALDQAAATVPMLAAP